MTVTVPPLSDPTPSGGGDFADSGASLRLDAISSRIGRMVPLDFAEQWRLAPVEQTAFEVIVAAARPLPPKALAQLERFVGAKVRIVRSTSREIRDALARIWQLPQPIIPEESVGEWLITLGFVTAEQARRAVDAHVGSGHSLLSILQAETGLDEEQWNQALGLCRDLPTVALDRVVVPRGVSALLSRAEAISQRLLPVSCDGRFLMVAVTGATDPNAVAALGIETGYAVRRVLATEAALTDAIDRAFAAASRPLSPVKALEETLIATRAVLRDELDFALRVVSRTNEKLDDALLRLGFTTADKLLVAQAARFGVPPLIGTPILPMQAAAILPGALAVRRQAIIVGLTDTTVRLATATPNDPRLPEWLRYVTGREVEVVYADSATIDRLQRQFYSGRVTEAGVAVEPFERMLLRDGVITREQVETLRSYRSDNQCSYPRALVETGILPESTSMMLQGLWLGLCSVSLETVAFDRDLVERCGPAVLMDHRMIPLRQTENAVYVAVADPFDTDGLDSLERALGRPVEPVLARPSDIVAALERIFLNTNAPTQRRLLAVSDRLLRARVITAVFWQAIARRMNNGEPLDVALGVVTGVSGEQAAKSLARAFALPYESLTPRQEIQRVIEANGLQGERRRWHDPVDPVVARLIGRDTAQQVGALPIRMENDTLVVACADPSNTPLLEALAAGFGATVRWVVASRQSLVDAIQRTLGRKNLGTQLLETGLITEAELNRALDYQRRVGTRLGAALITLGIIRPEAVADFLARQFNLLHVDLATMPIYGSIVRQIPEAMAREYGVIPIAADETSITIAMVDPLDDRAVEAVREHTGKIVERVVATESAVFAALQDVYRDEYLHISAMDLVVRKPEDSASRVLSRGQKWFFIGLIAVSVVALFVNAVAFFIVVNTLATAFYFAFSAFKFYIIYRALGHKLDIEVTPEELAALDERTLPMYTILIPLYKEASVAQQLIRAVDKLDYPKAKLDVKLLIEEDDPETLDGIIKGYMPSHFKIVIIPHGKPKGKPKACNYGLIQALGEYVVIYDAEDRPEADQLKKVVVAFRKSASDLACIQCKLNYFNRNQNILTRWFTIEYSMWFDLLLPGLDAAKAPIPLGGTSNHFRTDVLRQVGAWDPWNVTEDADLGTRLYKLGLKTAVVDSTTYEEANSQLWNWIRQRSRWVKGYIQTWLVHMRNPIKLWRDLGPKGFLAFQLVIGGTFFGFLLNPLYWALTALWIVTRWDFIQAIFPTVVFYLGAFALYFGNFAFAYINVAGCIRRQYYSLVPYAVISPIYWALMSVAAWKGFLQLFTNPFYWEKTIHGLDGGHDDLAAQESPKPA